jgi:hypothetical protein
MQGWVTIQWKTTMWMEWNIYWWNACIFSLALSSINPSLDNPNNWIKITYSCWEIMIVCRKEIMISLSRKTQHIDPNSIGK